MNADNLELWAHSLLLKIHVITGWTIPNSDELMTILIDQFQKTLVEKYSMLNPDEIEYAFRNHGTSLEDWGKAMNLNLVDAILSPYTHKRFDISEDERRVNTKKDYEQRIFTQQELDDSAREDVERNYQLYLKQMEVRGVSINKPILEQDGLIREGESVMDFFKRRALNGSANIYVKQVEKK